MALSIGKMLVQICGWVYLVSFFLFGIVLVYTWRSGAPAPDVVHTVVMEEHGKTRYITAGQSRFYDGVAIVLAGSGVLAVVGSGVLYGVEKSRSAEND